MENAANTNLKKFLRMFRFIPQDKIRRSSYPQRIAVHTIAGAALGIFLLHPLSMIAHNIFCLENIHFLDVITVSFSSQHFPMTLYFFMVGSIFGYVHGNYRHLISMLHENVRMQALSDQLTGLYNRRYFMNQIEQQVGRARRYEQPLSLLMIDVDFFKCFNDTHGHPAGDELLASLGQLLRDQIRDSDFAARYGGEEFVIVMPETGREGALPLARRICESVSEHPFRHREKQPGGKVTISAGVACFPTDAHSAEQLIQKADQALYKAKREGKNRVCRAAPRCREDVFTLQPA